MKKPANTLFKCPCCGWLVTVYKQRAKSQDCPKCDAPMDVVVRPAGRPPNPIVQVVLKTNNPEGRPRISEDSEIVTVGVTMSGEQRKAWDLGVKEFGSKAAFVRVLLDYWMVTRPKEFGPTK